MADLVFSPEASSDLAGIYAVSAVDFGEDTAKKYLAGIQNAVGRLAQFPESCTFYPGLQPPVRYLAYKRHRIIYDYDGEIVRVIRIIHQARDVRRLI